MESKSSVKISCEQCNLPFWLEEQLKKRSVTYKWRETFNCTHFQKDFVRGNRFRMHEHTCEKNTEKKNALRKYSTFM